MPRQTLPSDLEPRVVALEAEIEELLASKPASGKATLIFTASKNSAAVAINHGLGRVPTVVLITSFNAPAFGQIPLCNTFSFTGTQFTVNGEITGAAITGNIEVNWFAI